MNSRRIIRWATLGGLGLLFLLLAPEAAQANQALLFETGLGQCTNNVPGPSVKGIVADAAYSYVSRFDGRVLALDLPNGRAVWDLDFTRGTLSRWDNAQQRYVEVPGTRFEPYAPRTRGYDLLQDASTSGRLYVALTDTESAAGRASPEGVVAINKADGRIVWESRTTFADYPLPDDPLALGQDPTHIYVGTLSGYIFKIDKVTGQAVLDSTGERPLQYRGPPHPFGYKMGVWAMVVEGTRMWAALNYGGIPTHEVEKPNPQAFDLLETSVNNRIAILDTQTLRYAAGVPGPLRAFNSDDTANQNVIDEQSPRALPAILSLWTSPSLQWVYMGGRGVSEREDNRTFSVVLKYSKQDVGQPPAGGQLGDDFLVPVTPAGNTALGAMVIRRQQSAPPGAPTEQPLAGGVNEIMGDENFLYVASNVNHTSANIGAGGSRPPGVGANVVKLRLDNLNYAGWDRRKSALSGAEDFGRRIQAWHAVSLWVEPGALGRVWVGHNCDNQSPFPSLTSAAAAADDDGAIHQKYGALVVQLPKDDLTPTGLLMYPTGRDVTNGTYAVGFRVDLPVPPDQAPRINAELSVRDERDPLQPSPWRRMEGFKLNNFDASLDFPGNYWFANNVVLTWADPVTGAVQALPDGPAFRARLDLRDGGGGLLYQDVADGTFMIDRKPPTMVGHTPTEGFVSTRGDFKITVDGFDPESDVSLLLSEIIIDGTVWPSRCITFYWDGEGHVFRFELDIAKAILTCDVAPQTVPLSDGFHVIRANLYDRARNFAFSQWRVKVDTTVRVPEFAPLSGSWTPERRPTLSAQFFEDVSIKYAYLDGIDVRGRLLVSPADPVTNPLGTRIVLRPDFDLRPGDHALEIWAEDKSKNLGGPFTTLLRVDTLAPVIREPQPAPSALLTTASPTITGSYEDPPPGSGLRIDSVVLRLDGFDVTRLAAADSVGFRYEPLSPLGPGVHTVEASIRDTAGNVGSHRWSFTIDLGRPKVDLRVDLPAGQTAVKRGDEVQFRVRAVDESGIQSVTVDAQGLNPSLAGPIPAAAVAEAGVYELRVKVNETRTNTVKVQVFVTDRGGQVESADASVLVDNTPPVAFMKDLPAYVGATFRLSWENDPPDLGSGVAYYELQRQIESTPYRVVVPRIEGTETEAGYAEPTQALLRYRVVAVDNAGNRQPTPSNAVETVARGDPFENVFIPQTLTAGGVAIFTATPGRGVDVERGVVVVRLIGPGGSVEEKSLERVDQIYSGQWNMTQIAAGDYVLRFHFIDAAGLELVSKSYPVKVLPAAAPPLQAAPQEAPGPELWLLVLGLAVFGAGLRRRRRPSG